MDHTGKDDPFRHADRIGQDADPQRRWDRIDMMRPTEKQVGEAETEQKVSDLRPGYNGVAGAALSVAGVATGVEGVAGALTA